MEVVVCPWEATDVVFVAGADAVDDAGASKGYFVPPTSTPRPLGKAMCCKPKRVVVEPYGMSMPWKPEVATTTSESAGSSYTVTVFPSVVMTTLRLKEVAFGGEVIVEVVALPGVVCEVANELGPPELTLLETREELLDVVWEGGELEPLELEGMEVVTAPLEAV